MVEEQEPTTVEVVRSRLQRVMSPLAGMDLVRTNLVSDVVVKNGIVKVAVDLPADHQFAPAIRDEIVEKVDPLWDVEQVIVEFTE